MKNNFISYIKNTMPVHHIIFRGTIYEAVGKSGRKHKVMEIHHEGKEIEFRHHKEHHEKMSKESRSEAARKRMNAKWAEARALGKKSIKGL